MTDQAVVILDSIVAVERKYGQFDGIRSGGKLTVEPISDKRAVTIKIIPREDDRDNETLAVAISVARLKHALDLVTST